MNCAFCAYFDKCHIDFSAMEYVGFDATRSGKMVDTLPVQTVVDIKHPFLDDGILQEISVYGIPNRQKTLYVGIFKKSGTDSLKCEFILMDHVRIEGLPGGHKKVIICGFFSI